MRRLGILKPKPKNKLLSLSVFTLYAATSPCLAERPGSIYNAGNSKAVNLNLSSTRAFLPSELGAGQNVQIRVGSAMHTVTGGTRLTPAQLLAVRQVLATGFQNLTIDSRGVAVGGKVDFSRDLASTTLAHFSIPRGVTVLNNFAENSAISVLGNLVNAGNIFAFSTNSGTKVGVIQANAINNLPGGVISSQIPLALSSSIGPFVQNLDLKLLAQDRFINAGTISSSGSLAISAGNAFLNSSNSSSPVIQALNNISIEASKLVNSGLISASGDISILSSDVLNLNNSGGTIQALGKISISSLTDLNLNGGNFLSESLHLNSSHGNISANLNQVSGILSTTGYSAHVLVNDDRLRLGNVKLDGDPTYYNTGDILITGDISVGEDLAIISGGNITSTSGVKSIVARDLNGQGYDITMIAGATVTPGCGTCSKNASTGTESSTSVSIDLSTAPGGRIDFLNSPTLLIDSSSTKSDLDGGNITLVALLDLASTTFPAGGRLTLPPFSTINSSGNGKGNNGNVTLLGPGQGYGGLTTGSVIADGGLGNKNGRVLIAGVQAQSSNGKPIVFGTTGRIISGNSLQTPSLANPLTIPIYGGVILGNEVRATNGIKVIGGRVVSAVEPALINNLGFGNPFGQPPPISNVTSIVVSPEGSQLYTVAGGKLYSTDLRDNFLFNGSKTVNQSSGTTTVAIDPSGNLVYLNGGTPGSASIYNAKDLGQSAIGAIPSIGGFYSFTISPDGSRAYASNAGLISVVDTSTNQVVGTIPADVKGIAISPNGSQIYAASPSSNQVLVIDTNSNKVVNSLSVSSLGGDIAINSAGTQVYVTTSNGLSRIDLATGTLSSIPMNGGATSVAISDSGFVCATAPNDGGLKIIDSKTFAVAYTIVNGAVGNKIAINSVMNEVWVQNGNNLGPVWQVDRFSLPSTSTGSLTTRNNGVVLVSSIDSVGSKNHPVSVSAPFWIAHAFSSIFVNDKSAINVNNANQSGVNLSFGLPETFRQVTNQGFDDLEPIRTLLPFIFQGVNVPSSALISTDTTQIGAESEANLVLSGFEIGSEKADEDIEQQQIELVFNELDDKSMFQNKRIHRALIAPQKDLNLVIDGVEISIKKGACILIVRKDDSTAIFNLFDKHQGDVCLNSGGESLGLAPGQVAVVGKHKSNTLQHVGIRNPGSATVGDLTLFLADFSMTGAIKNLGLFNQLSKSQAGQSKQVLNGILKSTAAIQTLTSQRGPFKPQ